MVPYHALVERLFEMTQVVVALSAMGITLCVALFLLWGRYEEMANYIKDDGLSGKFAEYRLKRLRQRRIKRGECPTHGGDLRIYNGRCPIKGCPDRKEE
jgi:hypothetical protein